MINNFMCDNCNHQLVCEKIKHLTKFHESAKKDLMIEITMVSCADFVKETDNEED